MRPIVTIDGPDGSGKSHFATRLAEAFGAERVKPLLVRVDDYRREIDFDSGAEDELYWNGYYDLAALAKTVESFERGATSLVVPTFDGLAGRVGPVRTVAAGSDAVLLVEGVFVRRVACPERAVHVYLDADVDVASERLVARDIARGRPRSEVVRRLERRYLPGRARYLDGYDPVRRADLVIDNTDWIRPRLVRGPGRVLDEGVAAALARTTPPLSPLLP